MDLNSGEEERSVKRRKLLPVGTPVIYTSRNGLVVKGTIVDAYHMPGIIRYQILDDKDGLTVWQGNSRQVKEREEEHVMKRTLPEINAAYEEVLHSGLSGYEKGVKFAGLMTELEDSYGIPLLKNEEWEKENKTVRALYLKISRSRSFDDEEERV